MRKVKGFEFEIVGNEVWLYKNGEVIKLKLEFGESGYSKCYLYLIKKESGREEGFNKVGNFLYSYDEVKKEVEIFNNKKVLLFKKELKDEEVKYIRNSVINILINNLE
jgi:hypothetical protein